MRKVKVFGRAVPLWLLAAVLIGFGILALTGIFAPTAAINFTADDVTIISDDGQIKSVTISPKGTFSWSGHIS